MQVSLLLRNREAEQLGKFTGLINCIIETGAKAAWLCGLCQLYLCACISRGLGSLGAGEDLGSRPKHFAPLLQMFLIKKKSISHTCIYSSCVIFII